MSDIITLCHDSMLATLLALPDVGPHVSIIYNVAELMDNAKGVTAPVFGVLYEGARSLDDPPKHTHKIGAAGELVQSVLCLFPTNRLGATKYVDGTTIRDKAVATLGVIRRALINTRSPSNHFWRFNLEAPAVEKNGVVLWVQRWSTPVIFL